MIRSSKFIMKYQNKQKDVIIHKLFSDYKIALQECINSIMNKQILNKTHLSSKLIPDFSTIKQSNWKTVVYSDASGIVRGNMEKLKRNLYKKYKKVYFKCKKNNKHLKFLNKKYNKLNINYLKRLKNKIEIKNISIDLNYLQDKKVLDCGEFNEFIRIRLPYFQDEKQRLKTINLPIKYHKQSLKFENWEEIKTVKLIKEGKNIFLMKTFEKKDICKKTSGGSLGIDIGYRKLVVCSDGQMYGEKLNDVYIKLSRQKQGSVNFKQTLKERDKLINESCNRLNIEGIKELFIEDLKNVKSNSKVGHKTMNKLQRWSYPKVINKLERLSEEKGFLLTKVDPAYTSQICNKCGFKHEDNRKLELFKCLDCGMEMDADLNASINILHRGVYNLST